MECPKCQGPMRSYERNGITIDQCIECRGIYLDRGELEHLISLEAAQSAPRPAAAAPQQPQQQQPAYAVPAYQQQVYVPQGGYSSHGKPKRRKSFLEELFD